MRIGLDCTWLVLTFALAAPNALTAQEPFAIKRTALPALDSQVRARLVALDRRLNPVHTPQLAVTLVGQLANPDHLLSGFGILLCDSRNNEVWEHLADEYHRMTIEWGDSLLAHFEEPPALGVAWSSGQVRRLCHLRLTQLPRATLLTYRQRVDTEANALLTQGKQMRSPGPLRRLVDELFCSSVTDQALDLLGDLAFERGNFEEARHWWNLLAPTESPRSDALRYPDPRIDLVRVQAKQVLATIFQGRLGEARDAIRRFQQRHPNANGELAGCSDRYASILSDTLKDFVAKRVSNNDEPWTTFGGEATRNRVMSQAPAWSLIEDGPVWRVKLPTLTKDGKPTIIDRYTRTRSTAFHPIVVNQQVLIADHRSVISYHLLTGKELFRYDLKTAGLYDPGPGIDAGVTMPRFTLSADDQRAYVRLGHYAIGATNAKSTPSYLICLDLTEPEKTKKREVWHVKAVSDENVKASFEGAPLVQDGRVYAVLTKVSHQKTISVMVCYDTRGYERWSRELCDVPEFERRSDGARQRHHLLTWADGQIVYGSHSGVIVAVDAWTGQPTWGVRYPSRGPRTAEMESSPRDLAPALSTEGCVIAAPLDSERIFCIDARSGRVRWESEGIEIVHLLGAAHGRVFGATRAGIVALDLGTGQVEWTQPSAGRLPSLGRGLLAGGWLMWPTEDADLPYRAVTLRDGKLRADAGSSPLPEPSFYEPSMMHTLPAGNLAFGNGCLAIAGTSELVVYVPIRKQPLLEQRPQARIDELYRQARRAADAEKTDDAVRTYRELLQATTSNPHAKEWRTLIEGRLQLLDGKPIAHAETDAVIYTQVATKSPGTTSMLPLVHAWEHDGSRVWGCDEPRGDFVCTKNNEVACRSLADGTLRWRRSLPFTPTHVERWPDQVALVSADRVQCLNAKDGKSVWSFAAPSRRLPIGSVMNGVPKLANIGKGIVHAERWDDTLLIVDDHRLFLRLHRDSGEIVWQYALPAAELRPMDGGSFAPFATRMESQLLAQSVTGQGIWLGKHPVLMGEPGRLWAQAPAVVDGRLILAGKLGRIDGHAFKPPHAKLWSYQAPWPTSLSGELCRLIHHGPVLMAIVGRNDGAEMVRLNPNKGEVLWSIPARELAEGFDAESVCIGDWAFYYVQAGKLHARSLNDGSIQWSCALGSPNDHWRIRYTKSALAANSTSTQRQQVTTRPSPTEAFAVEFIDPWKGERLQRLAFSHAPGPAEIVWTPSVLIVAAGAKIYGFRSLGQE